jgi:hypothetical protein
MTKHRRFFLLLRYITGEYYCRPLKKTTKKRMATATSTTNNNNVPSNYHTVTICADLPKIKKCYDSENNPQDLPPTHYWMTKMDDKVNEERYKVQHIIANGPCELDEFCFVCVNTSRLIFRYIVK